MPAKSVASSTRFMVSGVGLRMTVSLKKLIALCREALFWPPRVSVTIFAASLRVPLKWLLAAASLKILALLILLCFCAVFPVLDRIMTKDECFINAGFCFS